MKMKLFRIEWKDGDEIIISHEEATNFEHAEERFWESILWQGDCQGIEILKITKIKTKR